jgi:hypothetical protein
MDFLIAFQKTADRPERITDKRGVNQDGTNYKDEFRTLRPAAVQPHVHEPQEQGI